MSAPLALLFLSLLLSTVATYIWLTWRSLKGVPARDRFWLWLAYRLPRRLVFFAGIRLGEHASGAHWPGENLRQLPYTEAIRRWVSQRRAYSQSEKIRDDG